jgi:dTDP-4-amino-4,6-dideoxygalactose transaminase
MQTCSRDIITAMAQYLEWLDLEPSLAQVHLTGTGPVAELEARLCAYYGVGHALCVSNATTGLLVLALALDLRDAEFITTPYTYGGSLAGWLLLGNRPRFADIDPHTLTLDPAAARTAVTTATRALLAVDIYGVPCDMVALRQLADEHGLWYIADAAQSFGATIDGRPASVLADALVVSFTVGKSLCAGEGGAILTDNGDLYERLVWFSQHPARQKRDLGLHMWNELGLNGRIHPLAAVWANAELEHALRQLGEHQTWCFEVLRMLDEVGFVEPAAAFLTGMRPTFSRLSASWSDRPRLSQLTVALAEMGHEVSLAVPPVQLVFEQPAFVATYPELCPPPNACPQAKEQTRRRFCLTRWQPEGESQRARVAACDRATL